MFTTRGNGTQVAGRSGASIGSKIVAAAIMALAGLISAGTGWAQAQAQPKFPEAVEALLPQAKEEGAVVYFTGSTRYPQSQVDRISAAFEEKFGFPLEVKIAALGAHAPVAQRLAAELPRGIEPPFDVHATTARLLVPLRKADVIEKVDWAAFGIPEEYILPTEDGFLISTIARTIVYNTDLVKPEDVPQTLMDLLDPKWKGKIVAPGFGGAFVYMVPVLGEQETYDVVRALQDEQDISLTRSFTDVATKVANGEFPIGFGIPADLSYLRSKGAPIDNAPLEKVSGANFYGAVLKNAQHPAAAKLFLYFLSSTPEGQKVAAEVLSVATFGTPGTEAFEIGGEGRGVMPEVQWMEEEENRIALEIEKILGL